MTPSWCYIDVMDVSPYYENLQRELALAAAAGGDEAVALAERLSAPLQSAVRLMLLEALSAAADEITRELAPGSVEVRLRAGEPEFVVTPAPSAEPAEPLEIDEAATARINLRLPERIKEGVEEAAGRERVSVNTWLVRAIAGALANNERRRPSGGRIGQSYTGWVR